MRIVIVMVSGKTHRSIQYSKEQIETEVEKGLTNFHNSKSVSIEIPLNESETEFRRIWVNPINIEYIYFRE